MVSVRLPRSPTSIHDYGVRASRRGQLWDRFVCPVYSQSNFVDWKSRSGAIIVYADEWRHSSVRLCCWHMTRCLQCVKTATSRTRSNRLQSNPLSRQNWSLVVCRQHQLTTSQRLIDRCSVSLVFSARDMGIYRVVQKKNCTKFNAPSFCNRLQ